MPEVNFHLNGTPTQVGYDEGMHLLEVLRERCGIKSAKDGCAPQGVCGCCTILVDRKPTLACRTKPAKIEGREVLTLEGLEESERQSLGLAFAEEGAVQCGFCIPGIVARAVPFLEAEQTPSSEEVAKALRGHLCRCTGYQRIVDAIQTATEIHRGEEPEMPRRAHFFGEDHGLTRTTQTRPDGVGAVSTKYLGWEHALGEKPYVADLDRPGLLHGAVVLAEHPRAKVLSIDSEAAQSLPGVERVLTAEDLPAAHNTGLIVADWPVFVAEGETTRCVGDVLALVLADSEFRARQAAREVVVDYEVLAPVTDPVAALEADSPQVHRGGNLLEVCAFRRGPVEEALEASVHVIEKTYTTQRIEHAFLEPEACLVEPTVEGVKVYSPGQGVHEDQRQIAAVLGLPLEAVDVELVTNGGAFGGKEDLSVQAQTALAARLIGRPVRTVLTREQSIRLHPKRHPITMHYKVGADAEGKLQAVWVRMIGDTGAYASVGMKVLERAAGHCCGPYAVPAVDVEAKTVYTNNPPCGAMRGFGANQASFAIEGLMDILAERVGVDGYDIRERNLLDPGDQFATGQKMTGSCGVRQTLEAVKEVYKAAPLAGIACGIKNTGIGNGMEDTGRVLLRVLAGPRLEILTGYTEMGQGLHTILRQVVAEETGIALDLMSVLTCSDPRVLCGMTTASRATALCTEAGGRAGRSLAEAMKAGGLEALEGQEFLGEYICDITVKPDAGVENPRTHMTFGYATQVVILNEDGRLERVVAAHDVGRAINPLTCAGQIEGAVHMGLGYALSEDLPCTDGVPDSTLLKDIGMLRAVATPEIDVILIEVPDETGGYGSKGVGEIGLVPTAGAVAGALYAYDGVRRYHLPMIDSSAAQGLVPRSRRTASP